MIIDLTRASLEQFIDTIFDARRESSRSDGEGDSDDIEYQVDPARQVVLLTDLFRRSFMLPVRFSATRIERGLWHVMGAVYFESFTAHIWNPGVSRVDRVRLVESVQELYDGLLARAPYENMDFRHPDGLQRRFETIDYMVPDLLLSGAGYWGDDPGDAAGIRDAFLATFARLLEHPSPVAQYAGLHGLGHLKHERRSQVIGAYLERHPHLPPAQRGYAARAQRGDIL
jgi:hypothetical protein